MNGNRKKRSGPVLQQPQQKHQATMEEEDFDEDIFLEETLLQYEEDAEALRDAEERQALASRLQKWKRPNLSQSYLSHSQNIGMLKFRNCCWYCCQSFQSSFPLLIFCCCQSLFGLNCGNLYSISAAGD